MTPPRIRPTEVRQAQRLASARSDRLIEHAKAFNKARQQRLAAEQRQRRAIADALADGYEPERIARVFGIAEGVVRRINGGTK